MTEMDDDTTLCWGCQADITEEVQFENLGEWFCEDCDDKIEDFVDGLRRANGVTGPGS